MVILDEIGRGTSTYDGLSLAWAISEHLQSKKTRTLFATHFHELTELEEKLEGVKNYNVDVKEWNDEVIFLHKIVPGSTDDSYGVYVAKLAGIPNEVIERSRQILHQLEFENNIKGKVTIKGEANNNQLGLFDTPAPEQLYDNKPENEIITALKKLNLNKMTPIGALNYLSELKSSVDS